MSVVVDLKYILFIMSRVCFLSLSVWSSRSGEKEIREVLFLVLFLFRAL